MNSMFRSLSPSILTKRTVRTMPPRVPAGVSVPQAPTGLSQIPNMTMNEQNPSEMMAGLSKMKRIAAMLALLKSRGNVGAPAVSSVPGGNR